MICIICGEEKEGTLEHIFPLAIGGTLTANFVCKQHNSEMGELADALLTDHPLILAKRFLLNIKGRGGIPNPIPKKVGTVSLKDFPKLPVHLINEKGRKSVRVGQTKTETEFADGILHTFWSDEGDLNKLTNMVNNWAHKKELNKIYTLEEIKKGIQDKLELEGDALRSYLTINLKESSISNFLYKKGILKIAYELGCYWLGTNYMEDPTAKIIRKSFMSQNDKFNMNGIEGEVLIKGYQESIFEEDYEDKYHIGLIVVLDNKIYCCIRIFDIFEAKFVISSQANLYDVPNKFVMIDSVSGELKIDNFKL